MTGHSEIINLEDYRPCGEKTKLVCTKASLSWLWIGLIQAIYQFHTIVRNVPTEEKNPLATNEFTISNGAELERNSIDGEMA